MQIDWFTFGAQILNFLLLIWLLKRFLYSPIIAAMDRREEHIRSRIEGADRRRREAEEEAEAFRKRSEELEARREEVLAEARREADRRRKELIREARQNVADLESRWREALKEERDAFVEAIGDSIVSSAMSIMRSLLRNLADADLDDQIFDTFIDRLHDLDESEQDRLAQAVRSDARIQVGSSYELDRKQRHSLTEALRSVTQSDVEPSFDVVDTAVLGLEVRVGERKLAWSADDYLTRLESVLQHALDEEISRRFRDEDRQRSNEGEAPGNDKVEKPLVNASSEENETS